MQHTVRDDARTSEQVRQGLLRSKGDRRGADAQARDDRAEVHPQSLQRDGKSKQVDDRHGDHAHHAHDRAGIGDAARSELRLDRDREHAEPPGHAPRDREHEHGLRADGQVRLGRHAQRDPVLCDAHGQQGEQQADRGRELGDRLAHHAQSAASSQVRATVQERRDAPPQHHHRRRDQEQRDPLPELDLGHMHVDEELGQGRDPPHAHGLGHGWHTLHRFGRNHPVVAIAHERDLELLPLVHDGPQRHRLSVLVGLLARHGVKVEPDALVEQQLQGSGHLIWGGLGVVHARGPLKEPCSVRPGPVPGEHDEAVRRVARCLLVLDRRRRGLGQHLLGGLGRSGHQREGGQQGHEQGAQGQDQGHRLIVNPCAGRSRWLRPSKLGLIPQFPRTQYEATH